MYRLRRALRRGNRSKKYLPCDAGAALAPAASPLDSVFSSAAPLQARLGAVERARALLAGAGIGLPGLVVVGAQNSGKSSLLESISGIALPRGEGTVTTCPIVVSLEVDPSIEEPRVIVAADAAYMRLRVECALGDERPHIASVMSAVADGAISAEPIYIKIVRARGPVLTCTDLPGITAMRSSDVAGCTDDVEARTIALTRSYVERPGTLTLVVLQASDDFHNSSALRIALEHDPAGRRTLGVVTKVDTLPSRGDLLQKLTGARPSDLQLPGHGFHAVANRSQDDVERGVSAGAAAAAERRLFATHAQCARLDPKRVGVCALVERLVGMQAEMIGRELPKVVDEVRAKLREVAEVLACLPPKLSTAEEKGRLLRGAVGGASMRFLDLITANDTCADTELHVAARSHELSLRFAARLDAQVPNFLSDEALVELESQVAETRGAYLPNFLHGSVFRRLVKRHFGAPMLEEAEALVADVAALVRRAIGTVLSNELREQPRLAARLTETARAIIDDERAAVLAHVRRTIAAEVRCPFTINPAYEAMLIRFERLVAPADGRAAPPTDAEFPTDFLRAVVDESRASATTQRGEGPASGPSELRHARKLQVSLHAYKQVCLRRLYDCVPMAVRDRLIFGLHERLAPELLLEQETMLALLDDEPIELASRRAAAERRHEKLKAALAELEPAAHVA